jgi:uncharacterized protein (DUF2062 family)
MPRRFFTQLSRRYDHKKENQWYLRPFNYILAHPMYFSTTRRGVSSGLWLGLFIGLLPIPGQTMIAVLGAMARAGCGDRSMDFESADVRPDFLFVV